MRSLVSNRRKVHHTGSQEHQSIPGQRHSTTAGTSHGVLNAKKSGASTLSQGRSPAIATSNYGITTSNRTALIPRYTVGSRGGSRIPKTAGEGIPGFQQSLNISAKGGGAFRPISENFSVNQATGTLSLTIPIRTSPTRGGFGPDLKLAYDSGAGNGPFGFGWNLGAPAVQRKSGHRVPLYNDVVGDIENGDTGDELVLFGAEIVPMIGAEECHDHGFNITAYRPRTDSQNLRIQRWTSKQDSGEVHWRTISGDNVTSIYGYNDASRICDLSGGRKRISSWLLSRSYDAYGNAMEYVYKQEDGHGHGGPLWEKNRTSEERCRQKYLKRIRYGNRSPNRDLDTWLPSTWPADWMFTVVFDYGEHNSQSPTLAEDNPWVVRADPFSVGNAGFEVRTYRLCQRILMFHHFPEKLHGVEDALVWSTAMTYEESPSGSFLRSLVTSGHTIMSAAEGEPTRYAAESLPPWSFQYTEMPEQRQYKAMKAKVANLLDVPQAGSKSALSQWLDLDGEGIPGLLTRIGDGELVYQRNNGPSAETQFGTPEALLYQPSLALGRAATEGPHLEDLDHNGRLDLLCSESGVVYGFYERDSEADSWSEYSDFSETALIDPSLDSSISIDLTGDGSPDILCAKDDSEELIWQQAREKRGVSGYRRTHSLSSTCSCPPHISKSADTRTVTADMTGDGLTDLVEVSANRIAYWPNHGHGAFGAVVEMANPPDLSLAGGGVFSIDRLRLIDINGNGLTDILYLLPGGGANIYYNQAGNSWSDPVLMSKLPRVVSPESVFTLDLLGQGTACLCWVEPPSSSETTGIKYLDLMGGVKPYLLRSYENGMGMGTTVSYVSSTKFYLEDRAEGLPWTTRLPSPVHCVANVAATDRITGTCTTTDYAYHNGFYDPRDREFAGFELSEQWIRESIVLAAGEIYDSPVRHTKVWHSVGLPTIDSRRFFCPVSSKMDSSLVDVADDDVAEAYRALRGHMVRRETFGLDGTGQQNSPHTWECISYDIKQLQPRHGLARGVFQVIPRASVLHQFDRLHMDDPRVTHEIVLESNRWGDVESSLEVVYPRRAAALMSELPPDVAKNQLAGNIALTCVSFTDAVEEQGSFRRPLPWRRREYEVIQLDLSACRDILDVDEIRQFQFDALSDAETATTAWKALRSEERASFTSSDLERTLDNGKLQAYSILDGHFSLALTGRKLAKIEEGQARCHVNFPMPQTLQEGGFTQLKDADGWWVPSSRVGFSKHNQGDGATQLLCARASFYIPTIFTDAFKNESSLELDVNYMLAEETQDALGGVIRFDNDYHHLRPFRITDENNNSHEVLLDSLGRGTASCQLGKSVTGTADKPSSEADSWDGYQSSVIDDDVVRLLADPVNVSKRLLAKVERRVIWCQKHQPAFAIELSRNLSHGQSGDPTIKVNITYFDGSGRAMQHTTFHDPEDNERGTWLVDGLAAVSATGEVCSYEASFEARADYIPLQTIKDVVGERHATVSFYDALGRNVGQLFPDRTWTMAVVTPWATTLFDQGDTILVAAPQAEKHIGPYFARISPARYQDTWHSMAMSSNDARLRQAAEKSARYSGCPVITHVGSCGLPIRQIQQIGQATYSQAWQYDVSGNAIRQFDALGRLTQLCTYDHLHRALCFSGMDNGETWTVPDINGSPVVSWSSRGLGFRYVYDKLRRQTQRCTQGGKLISETTYGYSTSSLDHGQAMSLNLCGRVWQTRGQSGTHRYIMYDLRGHCVKQSYQPTEDYQGVQDLGQRKEGDSPEKELFSHVWSFDNYGNPLYEMDAQGNQTYRTFSRLDHAVHVDFRHVKDQTDKPKRYLSNATFTADGLPLKKTYGNGTSTFFEYDKKSRQLIRQKTILASTSKRRSIKLLESLSFTYDCMGRRTHATDTTKEVKFFRGVRVPAEWEYTYDAIGQLVAATGRAQLPNSSGQLQPHSSLTGRSRLSDGAQVYKYLETYRYDLAGNMLSMRHAAAGMTGWTRRYLYEQPSMLARDGEDTKGNRLSRTMVGRSRYSVQEYQYDRGQTKDGGWQGQLEKEEQDDPEDYGYLNGAGKVGCMTALPGFSSLEWNLDSLLASTTSQKVLAESDSPETTYFVYDDAGHRMRKVTHGTGGIRRLRDTYYLPNLEVQVKTNGEKRWTATVSDGADRLALVEHVQRTTSGNSELLLVRSQIGQDMELDDEGKLISYEEYSPFGTPVYTAAVSGDIQASRLFRFARYRWDRETGLYHCGARYYAAWLGRWTSPDPLGHVDGPNLYQYVANDPVNLDDHTGTSGRNRNNGNNIRRVIPTQLNLVPNNADGQTNNQRQPHPPVQHQAIDFQHLVRRRNGLLEPTNNTQNITDNRRRSVFPGMQANFRTRRNTTVATTTTERSETQNQREPYRHTVAKTVFHSVLSGLWQGFAGLADKDSTFASRFALGFGEGLFGTFTGHGVEKLYDSAKEKVVKYFWPPKGEGTTTDANNSAANLIGNNTNNTDVLGESTTGGGGGGKDVSPPGGLSRRVRFNTSAANGLNLRIDPQANIGENGGSNSRSRGRTMEKRADSRSQRVWRP